MRVQSSRLSAIVSKHLDDLVEAIGAAVRAGIDAEVRAKGGARGRATARRRRILPCIAPGCTSASKGPRFHYLCEKHRDSSKRDYEAWRKAALASRAGARRAAAGRSARKRAAAVRPCIAPDCRSPSKGPRFHYLCEEHRGASKRDYEAWRKAKRG